MRDFRTLVREVRKLSRATAILDQEDALLFRRDLFVSLAESALHYHLSQCGGEKKLAAISCCLIEDNSIRHNLKTHSLPSDFFSDPLFLGWAYQVWNQRIRDASSWAISVKGERENEKVNIAAVTQVFTDRYIADFLSVRGLRLLAIENYSPFNLPRVCDPAVGTGHILVAVVDALIRGGASVDEVPDCLFGYDIDPLAVIIARVVVFCQLIRHGFSKDALSMAALLRSHVRSVEGPLGVLDRDEPTINENGTFDIIVTNPPYLGRRKMPGAMKAFLDKEYSGASIDLCAAFLQRCVELLAPSGVFGAVTSDKWLRLRQYGQLRTGSGEFRGLFEELSFSEIYELGERAFGSISELHDGMRASVLIARKKPPASNHVISYRSLASLSSYAEKVSVLDACAVDMAGAPKAMLLSQAELAAGGDVFLRLSFLPPQLTSIECRVKDCADIVVGIQTSDDTRFIRYVWQAPHDRTGWRIHCRGGGYGRWAGLNRWIIDWRNGAGAFIPGQVARERAEEWIETEGWVYSWFANGKLGLRRKYRGWTFGRAAAGGVFPFDDRLAAYMNSRVISAAVNSLGGKIQLPEGTVKMVPVMTTLSPIDDTLVTLAIELKEKIVANDPTEALCMPTECMDLRSLCATEALLLVVEGLLEEQVEKCIGLEVHERTALLAHVGMVAGWYEPHCSLAGHPIRTLLSGRLRDIFDQICSVVPEVVIPSNVPPPRDTLVNLDLPGIRSPCHESQWSFPSLGIVETLCRTFRLHPFDALLTLQDMLECSSSIREHVYDHYIGSRLVVEMLEQLGYQWWRESEKKSSPRRNLCSLDETCEIVRKLAIILPCSSELLQSPDTWLKNTFIPWQKKRFFGQSPLVFDDDSRGVRQARLRLDGDH